MKIDLIIPTYKPGKEFLELMESISNQDTPINKIIIINTEQKFFDRVAYSAKFTSEHKNAEVHHISRIEFDNGKTRNNAVKYSDADYFIMMSQDAVPVDSTLVSKLLRAVNQAPDIAVAYARQLEPDTNMEALKYVRRYFYPEDSHIRSINDLDTYGWMTYFCSNICAIYKRDVFDTLGGFIDHAILNEDVMYASKAIHSDYRVAYASEAKVTAYRKRTNEEWKRFYFDLGVSFAKHPEVFNFDIVKDDIRKVSKMTVAHLKRHGKNSELIPFYRLTYAQNKGFKLGRKYKRLSKAKILKLTNNKGYWKKDELLRDRSGVNARLGYGRSTEEVKMINTPPVNARRRSEMEE